MEALTTYINDDPTARAWLNGTPDRESGAWSSIRPTRASAPRRPVAAAVDLRAEAYYQTDNNDCLYNDPVPFQPLVAAPLASLEDISEAMQYDVPNSTVGCVPANGRLTVGREAGRHGQQRPAPLHDRDHPAGRRPAVPAAGGLAADDERELRGAEQRLVAARRRRCSSRTRQPGPGRSRTASSRPRPGPRRTPARWSSTPRSRRGPAANRRRRTTRTCSSSPPPTGQTPGLGRRAAAAGLPPYDRGGRARVLGELHGRRRPTWRRRTARSPR